MKREEREGGIRTMGYFKGRGLGGAFQSPNCPSRLRIKYQLEEGHTEASSAWRG